MRAANCSTSFELDGGAPDGHTLRRVREKVSQEEKNEARQRLRLQISSPRIKRKKGVFSTSLLGHPSMPISLKRGEWGEERKNRGPGKEDRIFHNIEVGKGGAP